MSQREIFLNAPLRLVSLEIKFPMTARILTRMLWDALEVELGKDLPDVKVISEDPESVIPRDPGEIVLRRISKDHKRAVTLYAGAVTIEVADYRRYEDLKRLTEATLAALGGSAGSLHSTRMGLRYINEVKSKLVHSPDPDGKWHRRESWMPYINSDLLSGVEKSPEKLCAYAHRGTAYFHSLEGDEQVSLNYGMHPEGLVEPDDVLILEGVSGPCFVLDIDASLYMSDRDPSPASSELIQILDRLHEMVETIFKWSITDRAREVFRAPVRDEPNQPLLSASSG